MKGKLVKGGYIFINICIALFCVLGHIDSNKHIHRIFYIFYPNMLRIQGGEHCKQQNISARPKGNPISTQSKAMTIPIHIKLFWHQTCPVYCKLW